MRTLLLLVAAAVLAAAPPVTAGPAGRATGKLAGVVTDATGATLPGATVLLEGTDRGAVTDADGYYVFLNLAPDTYTVRVTFVGFAAQRFENVRVVSDQTTELDVTLQDAAFEGQEVVVRAEAPVVDVTQTSQVAVLSREDIEVLPVQDVNDLVELQAGVVDGHFRGGRLGEVQYQVDGVTVNNPYTNESSLRIDRSLLQEVQIISGTFDAEYGQALSGVVNAVLRDGDPNNFEASAEAFGGDYVSSGSDIPDIGRVSPLARRNLQLSLSGPLGLAGATFLVSGQRITDDGFFTGRRVFMPADSADFETGVLRPSGDSTAVALRPSREWGGLAKLTTRSLLPGVRLSYQVLANTREGQNGSYAFRLNPDGLRTQRQTTIVHGFDLSQQVSPRLFYDVAVRQNYVDFSDYAFESLDDPGYATFGPARTVNTFTDGTVVQGVDTGRFVQTTNALILKTSATWQATQIHLLKAGVEVQRAGLRFGAPGGFLTGLAGGGLVRNDSLPEFQVREYAPVQAAAYIQDRVEWRDLRVRFGLRAELFDANATIPSDLQNPANAIAGAPESRPVGTTTKVVLAPRLGVSFPVTDRASLFFSWGHFYQTPGLGTFFANADYSVLDDLQAGSITYGVLGNPDLRPEFTAQYEFGFKAAIAGLVGLDASVFYKDIRDLLGVEFVSTYAAAEYARLTNVDFGNVRGLTVSLDQRRFGPRDAVGFQSTLDYTLQLAQGNSSDPRETATSAAAGGDPRPRVVPFNWDQRHSINATATLGRPDDFSLTGVAQFGTGQPYTPDIGLPGFDSSLGANAARKPVAFRVDLRAEKFFGVGGGTATVFGRVFNLLDTRFANGFVFSTTGSPFYTLAPASQEAILNDPTRFAAPRRVEIGVSFRASRAR